MTAFCLGKAYDFYVNAIFYTVRDIMIMFPFIKSWFLKQQKLLSCILLLGLIE